MTTRRINQSGTLQTAVFGFPFTFLFTFALLPISSVVECSLTVFWPASQPAVPG
jgi:hypothetical protein